MEHEREYLSQPCITKFFEKNPKQTVFKWLDQKVKKRSLYKICNRQNSAAEFEMPKIFTQNNCPYQLENIFPNK